MRRETVTLHREMLLGGRGGLLADYDLWSLPQWRLGAMPASPRVLDIGANAGLFSLFVGERWPGAHVMAFEPHPETFALLEHNVRGRNVAAHCKAVSDDSAPRELHEGATSGECSLRSDLKDPLGPRQKDHGPVVDCVDAAELPPCDVLKIDTEGYEVPILRRYRHLARVHVLLAEAHHVDGDRPGELARIRELGEAAGLTLLDVREKTVRMLR